MERRLPVVAAALVVLVLVSFSMAPSVRAQTSPAPIYATLNGQTQGNYPGGNEFFNIFVVDSSFDPPENETILNMTLTAPFQTNTGIGFPSTITPGESILSTIALEIPANFSARSFTASLVVYAELLSPTGPVSAKLSGSTLVDVFAAPGAATSTAHSSTSGTVSTSVFAAGVAVPTIVAVLLLALLVRRGSKPKPM